MLYIPPPPRIKRALVKQLLDEEWEDSRPNEPIPKVRALAVRGYRSESMGPTPENDVGIVDDLLVWDEEGGEWGAVNANLDPSKLGWNSAIGKPFAVLQPGIWDFYPGAHRGRAPAYRQADDAAVAKKLGIRNDGQFLVLRSWGRHDKRNKFEWGHQQINIHPMTVSSTSSWACLTIPWDLSDQWCNDSQAALTRHQQKTLPVALINGPVV